MLAMFLFATTFYPLDVSIRVLSSGWSSACRFTRASSWPAGRSSHSVTISLLGNVAYLIVLGAAALALAVKRLN